MTDIVVKLSGMGDAGLLSSGNPWEPQKSQKAGQ